MKKRMLCLLVLLPFVAMMTFAAGEAEAAAEERPDEIKIALSAPFTGLGSILGDYIKEGAELAVDEINATGGILGAQINLVVYDDQANASTASTVVRKALFDDDAVAIFGPNMSNAVIGVHQLAQQAEKPMLVGATSPSFRYTRVGNDYLFRLRADDGVKVVQQVKYIVEVLGAERPGIIYGSTDYATSALDVAREAFADYGVEIVAEEQIREGDKDATGQILNFKNADIDVVVGLTHEPEGAVFVRQMNQLDLDVPVVGFSAWGVPAFTDLAGEAAVDVISVQGFNPNDDDPAVREFVEAYEAKWGREPRYPSQAYYDGVYLLKAAIEQAGSFDPAAIADALATVEYDGVQGPLRSDEHHNFTDVSYISRFDGEVWQIIEKL